MMACVQQIHNREERSAEHGGVKVSKCEISWDEMSREGDAYTGYLLYPWVE